MLGVGDVMVPTCVDAGDGICGVGTVLLATSAVGGSWSLQLLQLVGLAWHQGLGMALHQEWWQFATQAFLKQDLKRLLQVSKSQLIHSEGCKM